VASVVDICNLALGHLGDSATVAAISPPDGSIQAAHCARLYPVSRDQILETHPWGFATQRIVAAPVTNTLASWSYAYALPANSIRLVSVLPQSATDDTATDDFIVETDSAGNGVVYCNVQNATLRFIVRVTDTTKYSTLFTVALSRLLAAYLAGPVLKGKVGASASQGLMQQYKVDLGDAKELDANTQRTSTIRDYQPLHLRDRQPPSQGSTFGRCR
jgi:hypothetical protein